MVCAAAHLNVPCLALSLESSLLKSHSITNNNNSTHRANVWSPPPKTKRRLSVCLLNYGNFMRLLSVYRLSICSFHSTQRIIFESNIEFHPTIRHTDYLLAARRCSTKNCMLLMLRTENYFSPKIVCKMQFYVAFISHTDPPYDSLSLQHTIKLKKLFMCLYEVTTPDMSSELQ